jgi:hypothetical protein
MIKNGSDPARPAWRRLYALLVLIVVIYLVGLMATPTAEQTHWLDLLLLLSIFGAMWGWVRANRAAIGRQEQQRRPHRSDLTLVFFALSPGEKRVRLASKARALNADDLVHLISKN